MPLRRAHSQTRSAAAKRHATCARAPFQLPTTCAVHAVAISAMAPVTSMLDQNRLKNAFSILKMVLFCSAVLSIAFIILAYATPFADMMVADHMRFVFSIAMLSTAYTLLGVTIVWGYEIMAAYLSLRHKRQLVALVLPLAYTAAVGASLVAAFVSSALWYSFNGFPRLS